VPNPLGLRSKNKLRGEISHLSGFSSLLGELAYENEDGEKADNEKTQQQNEEETNEPKQKIV
jgi:hypothetical protein